MSGNKKMRVALELSLASDIALLALLSYKVAGRTRLSLQLPAHCSTTVDAVTANCETWPSERTGRDGAATRRGTLCQSAVLHARRQVSTYLGVITPSERARLAVVAVAAMSCLSDPKFANSTYQDMLPISLSQRCQTCMSMSVARLSGRKF